MNLNMIVGALVWLFVGLPLVGLILYAVTAPIRAARNAAARRRPTPPTPREWWK